MMEFNQIVWESRRGRSSGPGRDESAPTGASPLLPRGSLYALADEGTPCSGVALRTALTIARASVAAAASPTMLT
jgi:hypothetical protein